MSCCGDEELRQQRRRHLSIERQLKVERTTVLRSLGRRLLLLGDEAIQSDFISFAKTYLKEGMSEEQRLLRIPEIMSNIVDIIRSLSISLKKTNTSVENTDVVEKLHQIMQQMSWITGDLPSGALLELSQLCMDCNFQSCLESTRESHIPPNSAYFLSPEKLHQIAKPQYIPSDEDIANCKERSSTIVETAITVSGNSFVFCQVPKLPLNSRIYRHLGTTESLTAVVYTIDCGGIVECEHEDSTSTKLMAAIADFEMMWNSRGFLRTSVILLMITNGLCEKTTNLTRLETYYPEYSSYSPPEPAPTAVKENDDHAKVKYFIRDKILRLTKNHSSFPRWVYPHFIDVFDVTTLRRITESSSDIVQRQHLAKYALL